MAQTWHQMPVEQVLAQLEVDQGQGLRAAEAAARLRQVGPNALAAEEAIPWWKILLSQFQDVMVLVLLGATAFSYALGEVHDAITIVAIVILNAILGFIQEYRAEQSLAALRRLAAPLARVRRDGVVGEIPAVEVVPGDILLLEAGDRVAADARLISTSSLEAEESALTGESLPVTKSHTWVAQGETALGDRKSLVFTGTAVSRGRGEAVVVATGMETEMGQIAHLMSQVESEETPLQRRLDQLGKWMIAICLGICALVVVTGVLRGEALHRMVLAGISLAVAAIPEGLPAIVTVCLALGVQRMIKRGAIIRKLQAVETLGCATAICSDKTGTLTRNEMMVRAIWTPAARYEVGGDGYRTVGDFYREGESVRPARHPDLQEVLTAASACNNAQLLPVPKQQKAPAGSVTVQGDPTEAALLVAAAKANVAGQSLRRLREIPFESETKRMAVIVQAEGGTPWVYVKGAPDVVLPQCTALGGGLELDTLRRTQVLAENERMASQALRVLAIAARPLTAAEARRMHDLTQEELEQGITLLGLAGMIDPPRPEVKTAVAAARGAGIRTLMITGDHPITARAVAVELGLAAPGDPVLTGVELDALSDRELEKRLGSVSIFARVSPAHKLRIVRAMKARGEIVAMTGDGVNDAPAVKEADIGVAMGKGGTEVTKEASAMVLSDDNYATIVAAVREGRGIYDNIRKFIRYLLACNIGEVLTMFLAAILGLPLPLLPIQILWVNLVTDGLPAMALGIDPTDDDVMSRTPRSPREGVFSRGLASLIMERGVLIGLATLGVFVVGLMAGPWTDPAVLDRARTMAFATLVACQLVHVFDCRSEYRSFREVGLWSNPWLVGAVGISTAMALLAIYWHPLAQAFSTFPLTLREWGVVLAGAFAPAVVVTLRRLLLGARRPVGVQMGSD